MNIPTIPTTSESYAPPEWDAILRAAMKNDADGIASLVTNVGVSPSHSNAVQQSALHIAALWGNVEAVKVLLQLKANANAQNSMTGATPLHCAVQSMKGTLERRVECMDLLVELGGANLSLADFFGKTASEYCEDHPELAQKLQPQAPPIFKAIQEGNLAQVQELLLQQENTAAVVEEIYRGQTPFQFTLDLLLLDDEADENKEENSTEKTKLVPLLQKLLESGASVHGGGSGNNSNGMNPMAALENPEQPPLVRVCEALQDAYKNSKENSSLIALLEETCQLLLQYDNNKDKSANKKSPELQQLLHTACRKNELPFAKFLVEKVGIDPNVPGRQGMTPLQFAARSGKLEMVQYLLSLDTIDCTIQDERGNTALDAAKVNDKQEIVKLLEDFAAANKH